MKHFNSPALSCATGSVIESLENRRLLSTVTVTPNGDGTNTLKVVGTSGKDNIYIFDNNDLNFIAVVDDKNGNSTSDPGELHLIDDADVVVIEVLGKNGNDRVEYHGLADFEGAERSIDVDLGSGDDKFLFTTNPARDLPLGLPSDPQGGDITDGSDFNIEVEGEAGKDTFTLDFARTSIRDSEVTVQVDAGSNDDTVNLTLPEAAFLEAIGENLIAVSPGVVDDGAGNVASVLQVDIDLGSGNDTVNQFVETIIFNDSTVNINVQGQGGNDKIEAYENFSVTQGSEYNVTASLDSGNDRYHGEFNFNSVPIENTASPALATTNIEGGINIDRSSSVSFNVHGDDGNDKLEADHLDEVLGGLPVFSSLINGLLSFQLYGGKGDDLAEIDLHPGPEVSLGIDGIFRGIVSGDDGKDRLRIDILAGGEGGQYDLSAIGGEQDDKVGVAFFDDSFFGVSYGPRNGILLDGGRNTDKYDTEGNGTFKLRSVETLDESLENAFV